MGFFGSTSCTPTNRSFCRDGFLGIPYSLLLPINGLFISSFLQMYCYIVFPFPFFFGGGGLFKYLSFLISPILFFKISMVHIFFPIPFFFIFLFHSRTISNLSWFCPTFTDSLLPKFTLHAFPIPFPLFLSASHTAPVTLYFYSAPPSSRRA